MTADAMNCQKTIAAKVLEKEADYILAVKSNHAVLYDEIKRYMDDMVGRSAPGFESVEKEHGRIEIRRCWQSEDISWCADQKHWPGLKSFCAIESIREHNGHTASTRRYYISSLGYDVARVAKSIREHWHIENSLH